LQIQAASFVVFIDMRHGKRRLLLIDDPPDNLEFLTALLCNNYEVFSYGSSREARLVLAGIAPDLLFLDVRMFPINGVNFLREVRAIQRFCGIPAIAVTAMAHHIEEQALLAEGFQAIVTKPTLEVSQLEATINALLKSSDAEEEKGLDGAYSVTT
jgi:CheY-like chemotaxis protein